jgi:hypothetical protein
MARFRVFENTRVDLAGSEPVTFKAGEITPKDDVEGDYLVRYLIPWGLAERIEETPVTEKNSEEK